MKIVAVDAVARQGPGIGLVCAPMSALSRMIDTRLPMIGMVICCLSCPSGAQDEAGAKEKPEPKGRRVRLLAVGDEPLFRADLKNGVLQERELAEGVLPPSSVTARIGKDEEVSTRLQLGGLSRELRVPAALTKLRLRDSREPENESWSEITLPEGEDSLLVLLWRDPEGGKWSRARHVVLDDSLERTPVGSLRVVNVTGSLVALKFAGQEAAIDLKPGRSVTRRTDGSKPLPVSVAVQQRGGKWLRLFQGSVEPGRTNRSMIIVYRSDGEAPRRPANVKVLNERVVPIRPTEG